MIKDSTWAERAGQLATCCLVSAVGFGVAQLFVDALEIRLVRSEAQQTLRNWDESMRDRRLALTQFVSEIDSKSNISEHAFHQAARDLTERHGFMSVEWHPRITFDMREAFEREATKRLVHTTRILEKSQSGATRATRKKTVFPTQFVSPPQLESEAIGLHRSNLRVHRPSPNFGDLALTPQQAMYNSWPPSVGLCYALRDHDSAREIRGYVFATLPSELFDVRRYDASRRTIACLIDVTDPGRAIPIVSHDLMGENVDMLPRVFVGEFLVERAKYRVEFAQNPQFASKLFVIPWLALVAGPAVFAQRSRLKWRADAKSLQQRNDNLCLEIREMKQSQRAIKNLLHFREQECQMIANEIHDGFVQEAFGAQMFLEALNARVEGEIDDTAQSQLDSARDQLQRCLAEGRQLVDNLQPSILDQLGFLPAIQSLLQDAQERYGLSIALRHKPDFPEIDVNTQRALYRMVQESLSNIRRHSGAMEATITFEHDRDWIYLEVQDQGRGFNQEDADDSGFGLKGIRDRAGMLHGTASIRSSPGKGTGIAVRVPYL